MAMARTDVAVLGAGIVGTSVAAQLARRGLSVALVDRAGPGLATSYGNAGIIEGNTVFPPAFPANPMALLRIALKRAPEANYHLSFLPRVLPWLMRFRAYSALPRLIETAHAMRPLFSHAVSEHEELMTLANASRYLRKTGWLKLYRNRKSFDALAPEIDLAAKFGLHPQPLDAEEARRLEPSLRPVFEKAVLWSDLASISNPLAVTKAYAALFETLGGVMLPGDAKSLHRSGGHWRLDTEAGALDANHVVVALGPWAPDLLKPLGVDLPIGLKRGYHRHYHTLGGASLERPVLDFDRGYVITPMEQGIRLTTGVEFAARDASPTPVQFERLLPSARALFPLGEPVDGVTWLGARPCMPDSRPVIGRAPGQSDMWLAVGHAHWGLTLGPATGRLLAEMITGATPFCDPAPYGAERFGGRA
ncbi:MAG: amino acid dehydrogenase [Rhizobiales bacterium 64-17]|nr:MAG: amino acid dehydrogenase [Rhizobiales bacterium 64-17]